MYSKSQNHQIYYQKLGTGPDLIMLHGWMHDVSTFWEVSGELKKDFTLWLIDLPGFGRSGMIRDAYSVNDYAEIVKGFIEVNGLKKPHLLGHSLGGRVSIKLTSKYKDLIGKLILEDAAGIKPTAGITKKVMYPVSKLIKIVVPDLFNFKSKLRSKIYESLGSDYLNAGKLKKTLTGILSEDQLLEIPKIQNNTLVLWGENDNLAETSVKNAKTMYRLIKNSRLEFIENAGHIPHLENPSMFIYWVKEFLTD